jgi:ribosomal protein L7/L12
MSSSARNDHRLSRPMEPADFAALKDRLISTGRWRGGMFIASALLQASASAIALIQSDPLVRFAVLALTTLFGIMWFWFWYKAAVEYRELRATFVNADLTSTDEKLGRQPFWVDGSRILLVLALYLQAASVVALIAWGISDQTALAALANLGPLLVWPAAVVAAAFCLREFLRPTPAAAPTPVKDPVQDRMRTLEVRADNARLPEPDVQGSACNGLQAPEDEFRLLVDKAPRAAMILAWREVERALHRLARERGLAPEGDIPFFQLTAAVLRHAAVPEEVSELVDELRKIRNAALHGDRDFSSDEAEEYLRLSQRVVAWFRQATPARKEVPDGQNTSGDDGRHFTVVLEGLADDNKKISVIKAIREMTGCGLAEGKTLVDSAPRPIRTGLSREEAATWQQKLEDAGAKVQVA